MRNFFLILVCLCFKITDSTGFKRVCYYTNWSNHLQVEAARFQVSDIDPSLCTHAIFAFAKVNTDNLRLEKLEYDDDNGQLYSQAAGKFYDFTKLKQKNPKLVTLLSIGGQSMSGSLHTVAEMAERRVLFAKNCRIFLRDRNFDGLDIDWEYPDVYRDKFTELLKAMRSEFDEDAKTSNKPRLVLTIAGAAGKENIDKSYNVPEVVKYVDFINVMAYDFYGPWSTVTGFTGPLYSRYSNANFNTEFSQNWTLHYWIEKGAPREMLMMGTTATATSFTLSDPYKHEVGAPVKMVANGTVKGETGPMRKMEGHLSYYEVCQKINGATRKWDDEQKMNYAFFGDQWIGYNSPRSLTEKVKYAKSMGLGGVMFWTYDLDDFNGKYCGQGKFPLLQAIASAATNSNFTRAPTLPITTPTTYRSTTKTSRSPTPFTSVPFVTFTGEGNNRNNLTNRINEITEMRTSSYKSSERSTESNLKTTDTITTTVATNKPSFVLYNINGVSEIRFSSYFVIIVMFSIKFIL